MTVKTAQRNIEQEGRRYFEDGFELGQADLVTDRPDRLVGSRPVGYEAERFFAGYRFGRQVV